MTTDQGGFFERTQGSMHPVVVQDYSRRRMGSLGASSGYLLKVMAAHAVMLARRGIIPRDAAAALARTLCRDRKSTRLNSSHGLLSRMPSSA